LSWIGSLIDSHAHLGEQEFDEEREALMRRAAEAGVEAVVVIGYNQESSQRALELAAASAQEAFRRAETAGSAMPLHGSSAPALYATVGFAPHNVAEASVDALAVVENMIGQPRVVGVGEMGLDYHYDMPRDAQRELFAAQLEWAVAADLPVVIHSRKAEEDVVALLRDGGAGSVTSATPNGSADPAGSSETNQRLRGVIHCFTESAHMARAVVDLGFYVSFSGILTFPSAADLRKTAAEVPLGQTLIETDSPYLAPQPYRGRRNEPAFVGAVAEELAVIHACDVEEVAEATAGNARRLFGLV